MNDIIAVVGGLLAAGGTVPYIVETVRGNTKPRIVTWLTWALLTGVAASAAFADHAMASGIFALLGTVATGSVVLAGLRHADRSFAPVDIVCMAGVITGLVLWRIFDSPAIGVWAAIIIDSVGFIPTFKHAWQKPHEETPSTFVLVSRGGALTVAAIIASGAVSVTSLGYPLYVALSMGSCAVVVLARKRMHRTEPAVPNP